MNIKKTECISCGKKYTKQEMIEHDNDFFCEKCNEKFDFCHNCGCLLTDKYFITEGFCNDCL